MKRILNYSLIIVVIQTGLLLVSCKHDLKSRSDIQRYINDPSHKLISIYKNKNMTAQVAWCPWQILATKLSSNVMSDSVVSLNLSKNYYFILSLSKNNQELLRQLNYDTYSRLVPVLSFRMRSYVKMIGDQTNSIEPADCIFQQTYGTSDANRILLIFNKDKIKKANELKIVIKEFGLGIGDIDFLLETKNMGLIDGLNYKNMKL